MLGIQNEREWALFCAKVLQRPELAADPRYASNSRRNAARAEVASLIAETFSTLTADQVIERLDAAQIANARVNDMHEVWAHAQLRARGRWTAVDSPAGRLPALLPPGIPSGIAPRMDAVPALGEHSEAILGELGYDRAAIDRLRSEAAI